MKSIQTIWNRSLPRSLRNISSTLPFFVSVVLRMYFIHSRIGFMWVLRVVKSEGALLFARCHKPSRLQTRLGIELSTVTGTASLTISSIVWLSSHVLTGQRLADECKPLVTVVQWLDCWTCNYKVVGLNPTELFESSRVLEKIQTWMLRPEMLQTP